MSRLPFRARLTLWNMAALALTLLTFAFVIHQVVGTLLTRSVDRDLAQQAAITLPPNPIPDRRYLWLATDGHAPTRTLSLTPPAGSRLMIRTSGSPLLQGPDVVFSRSHAFVKFHVLTVRGRGPVGSASSIWDRLAHRASNGRAGYDTSFFEGQQWRSYYRPWTNGGRTVGAVVVAYSLGERDNLLRSLDGTFLILIPLALLVVGAGGAFLTSRTMRPVRDIAQAAAVMEAANLSRRLPVAGRDEFSSLAGTFNAMFDRLQTAFKQLEDTLEHQKRFTADASHELRTPLTAIQANAEWALRRERTAVEHREAWAEVSDASRRMSHLVEDLLCLARSDIPQLSGSPVAIADILQRAAAQHIAPTSSCATIELDLPGPDVIAWGDPDSLIRLVNNLLDNALRHTPADGAIRLKAMKNEDFIFLTVEDTGEGIPPESLPHVCERFYRADTARSRPGGAGLGLAICQGIVRQHGGELRIESAPGQGTTVTVILPAM